jgi:hypothetical protein
MFVDRVMVREVEVPLGKETVCGQLSEGEFKSQGLSVHNWIESPVWSTWIVTLRESIPPTAVWGVTDMKIGTVFPAKGLKATPEFNDAVPKGDSQEVGEATSVRSTTEYGLDCGTMGVFRGTAKACEVR